MRQLSQAWQSALSKADASVRLNVTINVHGADPADDKHHLATQPGSVCLSTHGGVHVYDSRTGMTIPFWPYLTQWPTIEWRMSRKDRRAEISEVPISIGASADFGALLDSSGTDNITARVDAWSDGMELAEMIPLPAGQAQLLSRERDGGPIRLSLRDGDPDNEVSFPLGPLDPLDFPDAPRRVLDSKSGLTAILGRAPGEVTCIPLDSLPGDQHRIWGYTMPAAEAAPQVVRVNGAVSSTWQPQTLVTPQGRTYTAVVFDEPLDDDADVTAAGGIGITAKDPLTFLADLAGLVLSDETKALLKYELGRQDRAFQMDVLSNVQASVISLLRDRLLGQTPYAMTFERGKMRLLRLDDSTTQIPLGIGHGLKFRLRSQPAPSENPVYNSFVFECGRDLAGGGYLLEVRRDAGHGPADVRAALARSVQAQRAIRPFPKRVELHDLAVQVDSNGDPVRCPAGERTADLYALTYCRSTRQHAYQADWLMGLTLERNDAVLLTDDSQEGLAGAPGFVELIRLAQAGPQVAVEVAL